MLLKPRLNDIVQSASLLTNEINLLLFCYGPKKNFEYLRNLCSSYENCYLFPAVDRITLINILKICDNELQYYDPLLSVNHLYAALSKFYEYLSVCLNIVSTDNEGINDYINRFNLGECIHSNEDVSCAISRLLQKY